MYHNYFNSITIIVLACTVLVLGKRIQKLSEKLDQTRSATYELNKITDDDIKDLRTSLAHADIPIHREQTDERLRWMALSPQQRHAESLAKFEETIQRVEAMWKEPDDPDRRDR